MNTLDKLITQYDLTMLEHKLTSCLFTLKKEIFLVIDIRLSKREKFDDIARLLNKI